MATEQLYFNSDNLTKIVQAAAELKLDWKDFVVGAAVEKADRILIKKEEVK